MAKLTLIRHGQASFLADDYDHLSPLGEDQARRLGAHLAAEGLRPDRIFTGPLRRQRHTAALAAGAAAAAGLPWPDAVELDELREHQGEQLLRQHLPALLDASPELAALARDVAAGTVDPRTIDAERFGSYLPTAMLPPVDLLIRTSGEQRISNFLLWELAYAELVFIDVMWPDFRRRELHRCLEQYAGRERRFGKTGAQLADDDSDVESTSAP